MERWDIQQLQSPLLKHLLSSHISLRTRRYKLAPADALQIAGCSSCIVIESFPSYSPHWQSPCPCRPPLPSPLPPMLLLALHPIAVLRYQSTAMRLAPASPSSQTTPRRPCPGTTPRQRWPGCHAGRMDGQTGRQAGRQTDTRPCDFSVILESILSNFAICPGGNDGSVELICRLLALLRLYRTSFWSRMQARVCSPLELRGVSIEAPGSHHSIMGCCVSDTKRLTRNTSERNLRRRRSSYKCNSK